MRIFSNWNPADEQLPDEITWNPLASRDKHKKSDSKIDIAEVFEAHKFFSQTDVIQKTPLMHSSSLSAQYSANIYIKREDHQRGRTYKIRAAYYQHMISNESRHKEGYIIVSDGNFAVSYAIIAGLYQTPCVIYVPEKCHSYKLAAMAREGKEYIRIVKVGADFQACTEKAQQYSKETGIPLLVSFDTPSLLNGYATIAKEIVEASMDIVYDYILVPAGSGALASAISSMIKQISPSTKVLAVEPDICKPYSTSIRTGELTAADKVSKFCNGSSIRKTSQLVVDMGSTAIDGFIEVSERKLAEKIIRLYSLGLICEPSGALPLAGLGKVRQLIKGKNVACILTGANIDLTKLDEAREMSAISKGIKNFYIIEIDNRKNVVYELMTNCFKSNDIISIQYSQRFGKQSSQMLLSVQSMSQEDVEYSLTKLVQGKYKFENINDKEHLLDIFF